MEVWKKISGYSDRYEVSNLRWVTRKENSLNPTTRKRNSIAKKGVLNPMHHSKRKEMLNNG